MSCAGPPTSSRGCGGPGSPAGGCDRRRDSVRPARPCMSEQPVAFDRGTGRRFVRVVKAFLTSEVRWQARGLFALLFAFALAINGLNVVNSYVGRDFMTAISQRDPDGFVRQAARYVGVF